MIVFIARGCVYIANNSASEYHFARAIERLPNNRFRFWTLETLGL